jgi:hypothetical protein
MLSPDLSFSVKKLGLALDNHNTHILLYISLYQLVVFMQSAIASAAADIGIVK